jgi:uncharacterized protein (TIGR00251 family)
MIFIKKKENGITLNIQVVPGSSKSELAGIKDDALKLKIAAPPVEGKANAECIRFLSEILGVKKNRIVITSGHRSRKKVVSIDGISDQEAIAVFSHILQIGTLL